MAASQLCSRIIKLAKGYLANRRAFSVCTSAYMDTLSWHTDTVRYVQHIHKYTENATAMVRPIDGGYWDSTSEPIPPRPKPTIPTKGENSAPKQPKKWFMKCLFLWRIREIREIQQLFTSCLYTKYKARARSQLAWGSFRLPLHPKIDSSMSNVVNVTALILPCVLYLGIDTPIDGTSGWSQRAWLCWKASKLCKAGRHNSSITALMYKFNWIQWVPYIPMKIGQWCMKPKKSNFLGIKLLRYSTSLCL